MSQSIEYTTIITSKSTTTKVNGKTHSINDRPAIITTDGDQHWYVNGKLHRDGDKPTIIMTNGDQFWHTDNEIHSMNDKPALICASGNQYWYSKGKLHRDNDQPAVVCTNGDQEWYVNGKRHRDNDQPAGVYANGNQCWYVDGKKHRDGGKPAGIYANGDQYWYINDVKQDKSLMASFVVDKFAVSHNNMIGMVSQRINISNSGITTVCYELSFDDKAPISRFIIDIQTADLNNITKMRAVKGDIWIIEANVNNTWITAARII